METKKQPEDFSIKLLKFYIQTNQRKFREYDKRIEDFGEQLKEIKDLFGKHSRYSLNNTQILLILACVFFFCLLILAFLSTSIEGEIGNTRIKYSANSVLQLVLTVATAGGGGIAIAQIQKIKK